MMIKMNGSNGRGRCYELKKIKQEAALLYGFLSVTDGHQSAFCFCLWGTREDFFVARWPQDLRYR